MLIVVSELWLCFNITLNHGLTMVTLWEQNPVRFASTNAGSVAPVVTSWYCSKDDAGYETYVKVECPCFYVMETIQ